MIYRHNIQQDNVHEVPFGRELEGVGRLKAEHVVDDLLAQRVHAMERLHKMYLLKEVTPEEVASYDSSDGVSHEAVHVQ